MALRSGLAGSTLQNMSEIEESVNGPTISRRGWMAALAAMGLNSRVFADQTVLRRDPLKPPYRVWFQPRAFHRDMNLYRGMTIDASGWLDPKLATATGRAALRWVYGTNHPHADGPQYWEQECDLAEDWPGIAVDEWVPSPVQEMEEWVAEGLTAGKQKHSDKFIAVWVTDPTPTLARLAKAGVVDLVIVQGYTHAAPRYGKHATLHWTTALKRCEMAKELGIEAKSIFSFGHITADKNADGETLDVDQLAERAEEIKERFPAMPGVAFFEDDSDDSPELRQIVRACDEVSRKLWPDPSS